MLLGRLAGASWADVALCEGGERARNARHFWAQDLFMRVSRAREASLHKRA